VSKAQTALLERGARNAVETCLAVRSTDRVCVITDEETQVVGDALTRASQQAGAAVETLLLESFGRRPLTSLPDTLRAAIERVDPTCSFYAAAAKKGEISFRIQLLPWLVHTLGVRHGHMPGITPALMTEGMLADYDEVSRMTSRVADIVRPARQIQVRSAKGSDIVAQFSPQLRWVPCPGLYRRQSTWGNLPEGEVFTSPARVDGLLTVDELGDYFSEQYGVLPQPVTFRIEDSIAVEITSENTALANELAGYLDSSENGRRVGEFAIGTNTALTRLVGNLLQDEKYPGVHVAFGNPYPDETGATWRASVHVDTIPTDCDIDVDGRPLMRAGRFIFDT
jgi:aminopeptidase